MLHLLIEGWGSGGRAKGRRKTLADFETLAEKLSKPFRIASRRLWRGVHLKISCGFIGWKFFHSVWIGWFFRWTPRLWVGVETKNSNWNPLQTDKPNTVEIKSKQIHCQFSSDSLASTLTKSRRRNICDILVTWGNQKIYLSWRQDRYWEFGTIKRKVSYRKVGIISFIYRAAEQASRLRTVRITARCFAGLLYMNIQDCLLNIVGPPWTAP